MPGTTSCGSAGRPGSTSTRASAWRTRWPATRNLLAARGEHLTLVPTWRGAFGTDMAGEVLLPGDGARLGGTTFDEWLAAGAH